MDIVYIHDRRSLDLLDLQSVPEVPVIVQVSSIWLRDSPQAEEFEVLEGDFMVLYAHAVDTGGRWCFCDGMPVAELLEQLSGTLEIDVIFACNPCKEKLVGNYHYVLGDVLGSIVRTKRGVAVKLAPKSPGDKLIRKDKDIRFIH